MLCAQHAVLVWKPPLVWRLGAAGKGAVFCVGEGGGAVGAARCTRFPISYQSSFTNLQNIVAWTYAADDFIASALAGGSVTPLS